MLLLSRDLLGLDPYEASLLKGRGPKTSYKPVLLYGWAWTGPDAVVAGSWVNRGRNTGLASPVLHKQSVHLKFICYRLRVSAKGI